MTGRRRDIPPEERSAYLKERVYVTFTALAVVIALRSHAEHLEAGDAALTLAVTILGVLLASFVAEIVAHVITHDAFPERGRLARAARTSYTAFGAVTVPLVLLGLAALDVVGVDVALKAGQTVLVVTLGVVVVSPLRRLPLPGWKKAALVVAMAGVGVLAVLLEVLAHTV